MSAQREHNGWVLQEHGPSDADHTVLLLPGGMCTAAFYEDLVAEPKLSGASIRLVATTPPGYADVPPPDDLSMENYARLASELAADLGSDAVVGHSMGANIAIEMAASDGFSGPLLLLAPSFSREDEALFLRVLDRLGRVLGRLPFAAMLKIIGIALKGEVPEDRHDALIAEMRKNDPGLMRALIHEYLEYLDRHGSVVPRLCDSGVRACVVLGEDDDVGLTDKERRGVEECPRTMLVEIPDVGHMTLNQVPARVADLTLEMLSG